MGNAPAATKEEVASDERLKRGEFDELHNRAEGASMTLMALVTHRSTGRYFLEHNRTPSPCLKKSPSASASLLYLKDLSSF